LPTGAIKSVTKKWQLVVWICWENAKNVAIRTSFMKTKGLRNISEKARNSHHSLHFEPDDQLCTSCRKRVAALPEGPEELRTVGSSQSEQSEAEGVNEAHPSEDMPGTSAGTDALYISPDHEISVLNASLSILGESPIIKRKLNTRALYVKEKARKIEGTVRRKIELGIGCAVSEAESVESPESEMLNQLKDKFKSSKKRSEKIQILTILPKSWTRRRVVEEFHVSEYMARKARKLVSEKGIMSTPNPKLGKILPRLQPI